MPMQKMPPKKVNSNSSSNSNSIESINARSLRFARPNAALLSSNVNSNRPSVTTVSSTPGFSGVHVTATSSSSQSSITGKRGRDTGSNNDSNNNSEDEDNNENASKDWPGPFSVARSIMRDREKLKSAANGSSGAPRSDSDLLSKQYIAAFDEILPDINAMINEFKNSEKISSLTSLPKTAAAVHSRNSKDRIVEKGSSNTNSRFLATSIMPSLKDLCIDLISRSLDEYSGETLDFLPPDAVTAICDKLNRANKLTSVNITKLISAESDSIHIVNCSNLDEHQLINIFKLYSSCIDSNGCKIRSIKLTNCGNCFTDQVVDFLLTSICNKNILSELHTLHIVGLYRLSDAKLGKLLTAVKSSLIALDISYKSDLSLELLGIIYSELDHLQSLNISGILGVSDLHMQCLCYGLDSNSNPVHVNSKEESANNRLTNLTHMYLNGITSVSDDSITSFLAIYGKRLSTLSLEKCSQLTDDTVHAIRQHCGSLRAVNISQLYRVSTEALLALFVTNKSSDNSKNNSNSNSNSNSSSNNNDISSSYIEDDSLNNTDNQSVTMPSEGQPDIPRNIGKLESVNLNSLPCVTDDVLIELLRSYYFKSTSLVNLDIGGTSITDRGFAVLLSYYCIPCPSKHESKSNTLISLYDELSSHNSARNTIIDVSFCRNISSSLICYLITFCPRLKRLLVFGNNQLNSEIRVNRDGATPAFNYNKSSNSNSNSSNSSSSNDSEFVSYNTCPIEFLSSYFQIEVVGLSGLVKVL